MANPSTLNTYAPFLALTAKAGAASIAVGSPVYFKDYDPANTVATVEQMFGNDTATLSGMFGILLANLGSGGSTVAAGGVCLVLIAGGCPITYSGLTPTPSVGDPLYVSDAGAVAVTAGTNTKQVGRVGSESSGDVWMFLDGALGSGGGGGSATAQVLLKTPDGDFPVGVDISDLSSPVDFTDTTGTIMPGAFGAPVVFRFDKGSAGTAGDALAIALGALLNDASAMTLTGGLVARWLSAASGAEDIELVFMPTSGGAPTEVAKLSANSLQLPDTSGGTQPVLLQTDGNLRAKSTTGTVTLDGYNGIAAVVNGAYGYLINSSADFLSPTNVGSMFEPRLLRRKTVTTTDATPTTIDYFDINFPSGTFLVIAETNIAAADASFAMYLTAKRVARYSYDAGTFTWTLLGSEYVPVPDDAVGPLAVTFTTYANGLQVKVTGDASTTVEWTAWTQFLLTKIG